MDALLQFLEAFSSLQTLQTLQILLEFATFCFVSCLSS